MSDVMKLFHFSCSTKLSMKFILFINVKMRTIVGILTFINRVNIFEWYKARKIFIIQHFDFMTRGISCSVELCINIFITSCPGCTQTSLLSTDKPASRNKDLFKVYQLCFTKVLISPSINSKNRNSYNSLFRLL